MDSSDFAKLCINSQVFYKLIGSCFQIKNGVEENKIGLYIWHSSLCCSRNTCIHVLPNKMLFDMEFPMTFHGKLWGIYSRCYLLEPHVNVPSNSFETLNLLK